MPKNSKKPERVTTRKQATRDPMQDQTPTAGKPAGRGKKGQSSATSTDRAQCTAHKRNGDRCSNPPVRGAKVCRMHGGSAPQVRAKANQRLVAMVLPAMRELHRILDKPDTSDADRLKAINAVLNRTGYSERQTIELGLRTPTPWDGLDTSAFKIVRGVAAVVGDDEPALTAAQRAAIESGGGDDDDVLDEFLAQRDRARARDASTKLDNDGHPVVTGHVERESLDPFDREAKDRAASRRPSEYDSTPPGEFRPESGTRRYERGEE